MNRIKGWLMGPFIALALLPASLYVAAVTLDPPPEYLAQVSPSEIIQHNIEQIDRDICSPHYESSYADPECADVIVQARLGLTGWVYLMGVAS